MRPSCMDAATSRQNDAMPYHEWGRTGPPRWIAWCLVISLVGIAIGALVAR